MTFVRRVCLGLIVGVVAACNSPAPKGETPVADRPATASSMPAPTEVTLAVVKCPELERAIASHKGSVVVLDVWADY